MPVTLGEDLIDLPCSTVELVLLEEDASVYPWHRLRPTERLQTMSLRTVVLENDWLRAVVCLDLGGRLLALDDKRTGLAVLPRPTQLSLTTEGPRGAWVEAGVQVELATPMRANAVGTVDHQLHSPAVFLYELDGPLSWHTAITLAEDRAELLWETTVYNRSFAELHAVRGLRLAMPGRFAALPEGGVVEDGVRSLHLAYSPGEFDLVGQEGDVLRMVRHGALSPRQSDSWKVRFTPYTGLPAGGVTTGGAAWAEESGVLRVQSSQPLSGKLVVSLADGRTMEAPVELGGKPVELDLAGLPGAPSALALMDSDRRIVMQGPLRRETHVPLEPTSLAQAYADFLAGRPERPIRQANESGTGGAKLVLLAMRVVSNDPNRAAELIEDALLSNGSDPLAWWLKAVAHRHAGALDEDRPELLNAHYLAPLEPALRAEAFLRTPAAEGREPSPLTGKLAQNPDAAIEVACLYLEARLYMDAARLIDDLLRHRDQPMLRYLLAWGLLTHSRMATEAAEHVRAAGRLPIGPPYPWRPLESMAIAKLAERFAQDEALRKWLELAGLAR